MKGEGYREAVKTPPQSDTEIHVECIRDASLFLIEQMEKTAPQSQDTLRSELDRLSVRLDEVQEKGFLRKDNDRDDIVKVGPWPGSERSSHLLVINEADKALLMASLSGCKRLLRLIAHRSTDDKQKLICDALCQAVGRWHWNMVEPLLNMGADASTRFKRGPSVLQVASKYGNLPIAQLLLERGANKNVRGEYSDSALLMACKGHHKELAQLLLEEGTNPNTYKLEYISMLAIASTAGWTQIMKLLLERSTDANVGKVDYSFALQIASAGGHVQLIQLLLENGADVNAQGGEYSTALQAALLNRHGHVVQLHLEKGADVDARREYSTALDEAYGRPPMPRIELSLVATTFSVFIRL